AHAQFPGEVVMIGARAALAALLLVLAAWESPAAACCGLFVSEGAAPLRSSASQVVAALYGNRIVWTFASNYRGPAQDFAMVVPVPVLLKRGQISTPGAALLRRVEEVAAPRLVEQWEQPPCPPSLSPGAGGRITLGNLGVIGPRQAPREAGFP